MATSKLVVFVRSCLAVFFLYMILSTLWNWMTGTKVWTTLEMLISAVLTVGFFGGIAWAITNVAMGLLFGRNSEYRNYKQHGGDPFIDSLPKIFSPIETEYQFDCPTCGSPVQHRIDVCGHCGYGADGDSAAYFERYGDVKPPEINNADWELIRNRHHV